MKKKEFYFFKKDSILKLECKNFVSFFDNFFLVNLNYFLNFKNYYFLFTLNNHCFIFDKKKCKFFILSFLYKNKKIELGNNFIFYKKMNYFFYVFLYSKKNISFNFFIFNLINEFCSNFSRKNVFILNKKINLTLTEYYYFFFQNLNINYKIYNKFILHYKSKIKYLKYCDTTFNNSFFFLNNIIQHKLSEFLNLNFIFNNNIYKEIFNFFINNSKTKSESNNFFISFKNSFTFNYFYYISCFNKSIIKNKASGLCCENSNYYFNSNIFLSIFSKNNFIKQINNNLIFGNSHIISSPKYSIRNNLNEVSHENISNNFNDNVLFYFYSRGFDIISIYKFYLASILTIEFKEFLILDDFYLLNLLKDKINFFYDNKL